MSGATLEVNLKEARGMVIELDEPQRSVLSDLVQSRLGNLSSEIRHTDNASVRQGLRDERDILRHLAEVLAPAAAAAG